MRLTESIVHEWLSNRYKVLPLVGGGGSRWLEPPLFYRGDACAEGCFYIASSRPLQVCDVSCCMIFCDGEAVSTRCAPQPGAIDLAEKADCIDVLNAVQACFRFYGEWGHRMRGLSRDGRLGDLLDECSRVTGNLIIVTDGEFRAVACSAEGRGLSAHDIERMYGIHPTQADVIRGMRGSFKDYRDLAAPYRVESVEGFGFPLIALNIKGNREPAGASGKIVGMVIELPTHHPFRVVDEDLFGFFSQDVASAYLATLGAAEDHGAYLRQLYLDVLDDKNVPATLIERTARFAELQFDLQRCVVVHLPQSAEEEYEHFIRNSVATMASRSVVVKRDLALALFVEHMGDERDGAFLESLDALLGGLGLFAGASVVFAGYDGVKDCYRQALVSSALMAASRKTPTSHICFFDSYRCLYLLDSLDIEMSLRYFAPPGLMKVIEYDKNAQVSYTETLLVYLEEGCNAARCARRLFISRNSLLPRIERLKTLLGDDLVDPERRFVLQACLRLMSRSSAL